MVIGGVCLPVRFAGSKQGEKQIKEQTRMNNISVRSTNVRDKSSAELITLFLSLKPISFPFTVLDMLNSPSYRHKHNQWM